LFDEEIVVLMHGAFADDGVVITEACTVPVD